MSRIATYRRAVCRGLLQIAHLDHLWTGGGFVAKAGKVVDTLSEHNHRDRVILKTALAIWGKHEGPTVGELLAHTT